MVSPVNVKNDPSTIGMNMAVVKVGDSQYIVPTVSGVCIKSEADILDLIAFCGENDTNLLMLYDRNLTPDFFDLKTGFAGMLFQKLVNYHIRAVMILSSDTMLNKRFIELVYESNKGDQFRFYRDKDVAVQWLMKEIH